MPKIRFSQKTIPFILLGLCVAAFGLLIPSLGFYWDDFPMMWLAEVFGPLGFPAVFAGDRPFLSLIYIITTAVLDTVPWQWQVFAVFTRWLTALACWWMLRQLWPQRPTMTAWMAALLAIYPGFKQMPIAVVYGNGLVLVITYFLSFALMLKAVRNQSKYWLYTLPALLLYAFTIFSTEYYVGTDFLRVIFLWLVVSETIPEWRKRIWPTFKLWLPYLILMSIFLVWRVFIFEFPTYQPELIDSAALGLGTTLLNLVNRIFQDIHTAGWLTWSSTFQFPRLEDFRNTSGLLFWALTLAGVIFSWFYLSRLETPEIIKANNDTGAPDRWPLTALLTGLIGLVVSGLPYWVTNLPLTLAFPYDRFHLAFMMPACIFIVGLLTWLIQGQRQRILVLSLMIGMALGANLVNANSYRREWINLKDLFWQLSWRIPGLKPDTYLLTNELSAFKYYSDNSLTGPINWMYAPNLKNDTRLPYFLGFSKVRLGAAVPELKPDLPISQGYRNTKFRGNTSQMLVFYHSGDSCLHVLDPERDASSPLYPQELLNAASLSRIDLIETAPENPVQPPLKVFGSEPEHGWCYYYQKAELARQQGDWENAAKLGDEGMQKFSPEEPLELTFLIEAYAHTGRWDDVESTARAIVDRSPQVHDFVCSVIKQAHQDVRPEKEITRRLNNLRSSFGCPGDLK